jgi:MFS family permease
MIAAKPSVRAKSAVTLKTLVAGVSFVWQTKVILATITLDLFAVLLGGATTLLPIFAKDILHVGPTGLGWLRAAPAIGAFLMAMIIAHLPPMQRAGKTMLWAVAGFGVATIIFGISHSFWLSLLMLMLTGAFDNISYSLGALSNYGITCPPDVCFMRGKNRSCISEPIHL